MAKGGVKSFDDLHTAVGDDSPVDGTSSGSNGLGGRPGLARSVALRELVGNPYNPRDSVGDLAHLESIVDYQLQPAVAVSRAAFEKIYPGATIKARWVVVIGNRRLEAARKFGRPELDIVVKDELAKDRGTLLSAIIAENVDRDDFDVIEEAKAVEQLVAELGGIEPAARQLHKSLGWVSQRRNLLKLAPELQEALRRGDLAIREARTLARVPHEEQVARWRSAAEKQEVGEGGERGKDAGPVDRPTTSQVRAITQALKKFDSEPSRLATALRDHLGQERTKALLSALRKTLK